MIRLITDQVTLPPGAKLFTADAKSMYTNINTDHGTSQVENWIEEYHEEIPSGLPTKSVKEALKLVMHNNIFEFGDCFFEQLSGCAIGNTGFLYQLDNISCVPLEKDITTQM